MIELLTDVGIVKDVYTVVDFYTYIKGVEYLICILFFCTFPMFYRYINKND